MDWLPKNADFRKTLQSAVSLEHSKEKIEKLAWLAGHNLGFLETIQLDRTLGDASWIGADGFESLRLALIGSATLHQLEPGIRVGGLRHRLLFDVRTGSYGQYRHEVLLPTSFLHGFAPQIVLLSLTAADVLGNIALGATAVQVDAALTNAIAELRSLWQSIRTVLKASVVQQTFLDHSLQIFGSFDRMVPTTPSQLVSRLNDLLCDAAKTDGVALLDIGRQSQHDGIDAWFDVRRWLQAKQEIKPEASALYGELFARIVSAQRGRSRKCLVFDLDNTLWGGVIGDDGIEGIILGPGSAQGEAHLALQDYGVQLKERGVILAVCSKNDLAIAETAFRTHPEMRLKRSDITAFMANWDDKAQNLVKIAAQLNIGIDSLVFVDDNPIERARIREALPTVAVPELPEDPAGYAQTLAQAGYFEAVNFTQEDRERAELYGKDAKRSALLSVSTSMDVFLSGLEMSVVHSPFGKSDMARVTQLINKTNQFNTVTQRYTAEEVATRANGPEYITLQFRLLDRYGDNGIVSVVILGPTSEAGVLEIETWVMSCRVFGRELEFETMNIVAEAARQKGAHRIVASYIPTERNAIVKDLYSNLRFTPIGVADKSDDSTRWQLDLRDYQLRKTHITRRDTQ
jgi:FkbH-like protein